MSLSTVLLCLCLTALAEASGGDWCYHGCVNTPQNWGSIHGASCGGQRQSPIDIETSLVQTDPGLGDPFTIANFSSRTAFMNLTNNGHTVKCILEDGQVEVSGGGLNGTYSSIQFHFHWGSTGEHHPGSEHTVDGHRYPMEMHVVSLKKGLTLDQALADPEGIAVLGFIIDATDEAPSAAWDTFTSYIMNITAKGSHVEFNDSVSISDLVGDVNLTKFYRYEGSLTTPTCNQVVVWTVFQEHIHLSRSLIERFSTITQITNVYRPPQPLNGRHVYASPAIPAIPVHWCYDEHCHYSPGHWHLIPQSSCGEQRQSPVDIQKMQAEQDATLTNFNLTKFDDKHTMKYMVNTGHSVKCVLEEGVEVSGGGLGYVYSTLQFHFHWGNTSDHSQGSEHTVDSKRYPMEMHIVNKRKDLTLEEAIGNPTGLAVLGFFIEADDSHGRSGGISTSHEEESATPTSDAWTKLTMYLSSITDKGSKVNITQEISIDDLLGDVDREAYYRYNGSLTTPSCNEAVVWTVFKNPIKVDQNLMQLFPRHAGYEDAYRPAQLLHGRKVFTTVTVSSGAPRHTAFLWLMTCFCTLYI